MSIIFDLIPALSRARVQSLACAIATPLCNARARSQPLLLQVCERQWHSNLT